MVLSYVCNKDSFVIGSFTYGVHYFTHIYRTFFWEHLTFYNLFELLLLIRLETFYPFGMSMRLNQFCKKRQSTLAISQYRNMHRYVLSYFRRVYVEMYNFGLFGICFKLSCHTVIETHSHSNQYITFVCLHIRAQIPVHAKHTFVETVSCRHGRKS